MTNELEKQFFNTFNIEPIGCNDNKNCTGALDCTQCPNAKYPQITDRIYLELHCLLNSLDTPPYGLTVEEFKKDILISAIGVLSRNETAKRIDNIKQQVRTLFEEG
jgi:hypothetical protein